MKKTLLFTLLTATFGASAADQYLYWMIDDAAKLGTETLSGEGYSAKVGYTDTDGNKYFQLYTTGGSMTPLGEEFDIPDIKDNIPTFANIGTLGEGTSFFIELLNGGEVVGSSTFTYSAIQSYLSPTGGMATPASGAYTVSSFTAVPEPTSGLLLLLGVAGLALRRKNKKA